MTKDEQEEAAVDHLTYYPGILLEILKKEIKISFMIVYDPAKI
jgi:hypothetical protein